MHYGAFDYLSKSLLRQGAKVKSLVLSKDNVTPVLFLLQISLQPFKCPLPNAKEQTTDNCYESKVVAPLQQISFGSKCPPSNQNVTSRHTERSKLVKYVDPRSTFENTE